MTGVSIPCQVIAPTKAKPVRFHHRYCLQHRRAVITRCDFVFRLSARACCEISPFDHNIMITPLVTCPTSHKIMSPSIQTNFHTFMQQTQCQPSETHHTYCSLETILINPQQFFLTRTLQNNPPKEPTVVAAAFLLPSSGAT